MKYILSFFGILAVCLGVYFCREKRVSSQDEFIRIHVTANSNSTKDQNLKYLIKDVVVEYLIPYISEAENKEDAQKIIDQKLNEITKLVEQTLKNEKISYSCKVYFDKEEAPLREYGDLILEGGVYDSLKIDLGDAQGDNWWCVVFPAICFISSKNSENFVYISKIWEIINSVTNKNGG